MESGVKVNRTFTGLSPFFRIADTIVDRYCWISPSITEYVA